MDRDVVDVHADALAPEGPENILPPGAEATGVHAHGIKMPGGIRLRTHRGEGETGEITERLPIARRDFAPPGQVGIQAPELGQAEGAGDVGEAVIEPQFRHLVIPLPLGLPLPRVTVDSVVAKKFQAAGQGGIVRGHGATFAGRQVLHRMEAEDGHVADAADGPPPVLRPQSMAAILDDDEPMASRKLHQGVQISGMPGVVHGQEGSRPGRDAAGGFAGVDVEGVGKNVGEEGRRSLVEQAIGRGAEGDRGGDRLIPGPQARGENRRVERRRAGSEAHGVLHSHAGCEGLLELSHLGAGREPVGAEDLDDGADVLLLDRLAPVGEEGRTHGRAPV